MGAYTQDTNIDNAMVRSFIPIDTCNLPTRVSCILIFIPIDTCNLQQIAYNLRLYLLMF